MHWAACTGLPSCNIARGSARQRGMKCELQFEKTATLKLERSCSSHTERGSLQARAGQVPIN